MRTRNLRNIFSKLYQEKIIAYAGLAVFCLQAIIGVTAAQPRLSVSQSQSNKTNASQITELTSIHQVYQPARSMPIAQSSDIAKVAIANQAAFEQRDAANEELTKQRIAEERRLAEERRIAEEKRIADEKAAAEALRRLKGEPGENYPWANASYYVSSTDPWGMYKRQCVSYAAWKVASSGRNMPYWGGRGDAANWDENAIYSGIPVSDTPDVGSVAVENYGYLGHVMFVEEVYADGTILVSQYNADGAGHYSTERRPAAGLRYIHF